MKLYNKRGNTNEAEYYTGTGADRTQITLRVGPEPVELSQAHGEYMLNLFGKELVVVEGSREEPAEPTEVTVRKGTETEVSGVNVNYVPGAGDEAQPIPAVPADQYWCSKCGKPHMKKGSKIGETHRQYAV